MNLSWLFGSSMEARHLLYAYTAVWAIQGGYAGWIFYQWLRLGRNSRPMAGADTDQQ